MASCCLSRSQRASPADTAGRLLDRVDVDRMTAQRTLDGETHFAIGERKQGVILAHADIGTGMKARTALTHDDGACRDGFAAEGFDAQAFRFGIAAVSGLAAALFLCHISALSNAVSEGCARADQAWAGKSALALPRSDAMRPMNSSV